MWPTRIFASVPSRAIAVELAEEVRRAVFKKGTAMRDACDLHEVCREGGFLPRRADKAFSAAKHDALLIPRPDGGFSIVVDPIPKDEDRLSVDINRHRNRFRIAHEIGHSFFYDRSFSPPCRLVPVSVKEEIFCDEFASALLIPRSIVAEKAVDPASIFELHKQYDVSVEVAARSLSRVSPNTTIIGLLWKSHPKSGEGMRIVWSAGPRYLPSNARLRSAVVDQAATVGKAVATERLSVGGLRGNFHVSASRRRGRKQLIAVVTKPEDSSSDTAKIGDAATPQPTLLASTIGIEY